MALDIEQGYVPTGLTQGAPDTELPIFNVERVRLQFNIASDFVAGQVANDVLILALATGRILRIDLESPQDIDGKFRLSSCSGRSADIAQMLTCRRRPVKSV